MSLGLLVHVDGGKSGESRLIAIVGTFMTAPLLMAALERIRDGGAGGPWWLPLGCALACAGWCIVSWRSSRRRPGLRLEAMPDGRWRLSSSDERLSGDAVFVRGWTLGSLIWLHVRLASKVAPAEGSQDRRESGLVPGSADCRLLLARRSFDEKGWHALRRWLVWHRRSRRRESVVD